MKLTKPKTHFLWLLAILALSSCLTYAAKPAELELRGEFIITFNNCGCLEHEATGPELFYFLHDHKTNKTIELDIGPEQAKKIKVDKPVRLRGNFLEKKSQGHYGAKAKPFKASKITYEAASAEELAQEGVAENEPLQNEPAAAGAITQDLQCLIIHANSSGNPANASKIQSMENMVFNATDNMSKAVLAATYGHYRLTHGNVKSITVNLPNTVASSTQYGTMSNLMVAELPAAFTAIGQTFNAGDYDRYLICTPNGTLGIPTAWGNFGGNPRRTYYSYSWTGTTFDGILHELGHNFGFSHSGTGSDEYGDETCVMGYSHLNRGNNTATYSAVKKLQAGWFTPFANTETTISGDATFDIYPISKDPEVTPGMRCVKVSDSDHYISYRRIFSPYAWLRRDSDKDKVYVHRNTSFFSESWREQGLNSGSYTAGTTKVIFERYGPNNEYATVSFDMNDGNTKPVANAQSVNPTINTLQNITLTGSDGDNDSLIYDVVTQPGNGTLNGTPPNLTYTPNNNYLGADSFVFKVNDGKISSFATISMDVVAVNSPPVANNQSVTTFLNATEAITLSATDVDGHPLTYTVLSGPSSGTLAGATPNLTYTPSNNFSGPDGFTFKANDGFEDSLPATVTITVSSTPNTPPLVTINTSNQTIALVNGAGGGSPVAGAHYEWDASADTPSDNLWNSTTTNTYNWTFDSGNQTPSAVSDTRFDQLTHAYTFPAALDASNTSFDAQGSDQPATFEFVIDIDGNDGSIFETGGSGDGLQVDLVGGVLRGTCQEGTPARVSYTLMPEDFGRFIHVVFVADHVRDVVELFIDGQLKESVTWTGPDWAGSDAASLGEQSGSMPSGGSTAPFVGKMALFRYYKDKALTTSEVTTNFNSLSSGAQAQLVLDSTVTDPEQTPSYLWADTGTGIASGTTGFSDATSLTPTVTFTGVGTYILLLTADDGYSQSFDMVTITVDPALPAYYANWAANTFANPFTDAALDANPDGDQWNNMMEFAFGTDPTLNDSGPLSADGSAHGMPILQASGPSEFEFYFVRRIDHGTPGSLSYNPQFSSDLTDFTDSSAAITRVTISSANPNYEIVKVPFAAGTKFGRIEISQ